MQSVEEGIAVVVADFIDASVKPLLARIAALEKQAPRDGAPGQNGLDGNPGPQGEPGAPGPAGKDAPLPDLDDIVLRAAALIHTPKDGLDGIAGKDGVDGAAGKEGLGIREAFVTEEGSLVLTMSDGSTKAAGRVVGVSGQNGLPGRTGKDGENGKDGKDGLGFDDIRVEHDGERGFTIKFVRGDRVKSVGTFVIPSLIYRGIFTERQYDQGDVVTWAGSAWVAKETTTAKPGMPTPDSRAWQLCVKSGRDGKDKK